LVPVSQKKKRKPLREKGTEKKNKGRFLGGKKKGNERKKKCKQWLIEKKKESHPQ